LLKSGTDPNIATQYGWCPLVSILLTLPSKAFSDHHQHWAAGSGHYDCTKLLLEFGADPNPLSDTSLTPLDIAVTHERDRTIALLLEYQAKRASELVGRKSAVLDILSWVTNNLSSQNEPSTTHYLRSCTRARRVHRKPSMTRRSGTKMSRLTA
jgi:hypothetical protein